MQLSQASHVYREIFYQHLENHLFGRYALDEPKIERLNTAKDTQIFVLQQLKFIINLERSVLFPSQQLEFFKQEIDSVTMTLNSQKEKVKSLVQKCKKLIRKSPINLVGNHKLDRFTLFNSPGCAVC